MKNLETMLIPAIIQDSTSKDILMMGYMNSEALKKTIKGPNVWFYSRSKKRLWEKGETSKNYLEVVSITTDCDKDVLLIKVNPKGPTCHTGETMCFHDSNLEKLKFGNSNIIDEIFEVIEKRKNDPDEKSYTSKLFSGGNDLISQKVIEELCELIVEYNSKKENNRRIVEEACDLLFHFMILISSKNINFNNLSEEFEKRKKH